MGQNAHVGQNAHIDYFGNHVMQPVMWCPASFLLSARFLTRKMIADRQICTFYGSKDFFHIFYVKYHRSEKNSVITEADETKSFYIYLLEGFIRLLPASNKVLQDMLEFRSRSKKKNGQCGVKRPL